jgi:hypothetical protein
MADPRASRVFAAMEGSIFRQLFGSSIFQKGGTAASLSLGWLPMRDVVSDISF